MFTTLNSTTALVCRKALFLGFTILLCSCVSRPKLNWADDFLRNQLTLLTESCRITSQSGFSADVLFDKSSAARIDAIWDSSGNLSGQVLNPLGEDLLNFRVESEGTLQTDVSLETETGLKSALEFIANLGPSNTRLLLCSGLFLGYRLKRGNTPAGESADVEFELRTNSVSWFLKSNLQQGASDNNNRNTSLEIATEVFSGQSIFKKSLANIIWHGRSGGVRVRPTQVTIQSGSTLVKLTFLDFE